MKGSVSAKTLKGALNSPQSVSGKAIPRGNDGISPTVDIFDIEDGHRVVITDVAGEKTFDVMNGTKGADGKGVSVVDVKESTEIGGANVVTFSDGTKLTVMNGTKGADGTMTFEDLTDEQKASLKGADGYTPQKNVDYFDGKDGKDGQNGQDGKTPVKGVDYFDGKDGYTPIKGVDYFDGKDGQNGQDGKTPVKGTDYWTASDKSQMVSDVLSALPTWNGGSY